MTTPENKETRLIVRTILRVHPRLVTVRIAGDSTDVNLPITKAIYLQILNAMSKRPLWRYLPLAFIVDNKGIVYKICYIKKEVEEPPIQEPNTAIVTDSKTDRPNNVN